MSQFIRAITHAERPIRRLLLDAPKRGLDPRLPAQMVRCPECGRTSKHARKAISARCPSCAAHLPLEHARLTGLTTGRITTLGTVHITKKGTAHGSIECSSLTVEGRVEGEAVVRGEAVLVEKASLSGRLKAYSLAVDEGALLDAFVEIGRPSVEEEPLDSDLGTVQTVASEPMMTRKEGAASMLERAAQRREDSACEVEQPPNVLSAVG